MAQNTNRALVFVTLYCTNPWIWCVSTLVWNTVSIFLVDLYGFFPFFTRVLERTNFNLATNQSWAPTVKIVNDSWPRQSTKQQMPDKTTQDSNVRPLIINNRHRQPSRTNQQAAITNDLLRRSTVNILATEGNVQGAYRVHMLKDILQTEYVSVSTIMQKNLLQILSRQRRQINLPTNKTYHRQCRSTKFIVEYIMLNSSDYARF